MSEIEEVINSRTLTEQSKKTYRNNYDKLYTILQKPLKDVDQETIFYAVEELANDSVNNKLTYINIPIMVRQLYNKSVDILLSQRELLFLQREKQQKDNTNLKDLDLPNYNDVKKYVNGLYGVNNVKYIVNYLIFNYGVRNKDVNVFITTRTKTKDIDTNKNYLLVKNREIEWVRNDYKTVASYLQQKIIIKAKNFIDAVKSLQLETYLLSGDDTQLAEGSLNNTISRMLYKHNDKNMTERDYFKLNVKHLQTEENSYSKILSLGNIRGTNATTIEQYYNISKP
jgi:hypothetical protein